MVPIERTDQSLQLETVHLLDTPGTERKKEMTNYKSELFHLPHNKETQGQSFHSERSPYLESTDFKID